MSRLWASIAAGGGSWLGMLAAPARTDRAWSQPALLDEIDWDQVNTRLRGLRQEAAAELASADVAQEAVQWSVGVEMRYYGQGDNVSIILPWLEFGADAVQVDRKGVG